MKKIRPYFDINEFFINCSDEERFNALKDFSIVTNLFSLGLLMQSIREVICCPIVITSGFRDFEHNFRVGGVSTSQHLDGRACDFVPLDKSFNFKNFADTFTVIADFDQLIVYDSFIHISYCREYNRKQVIFK